MDAATLVDVASKAITSVAVLIGGGWAYIKFIRGRTFAYRAELHLNLDLVRLERARLLHVTPHPDQHGLSHDVPPSLPSAHLNLLSTARSARWRSCSSASSGMSQAIQ